MFYDVNNGKEKTPLHVLNAEMIHDACRNKKNGNNFTHYGLGINYPELLIYHTDMASYVFSKKCVNVVPSSLFHSNIYTTAAFDNFDHNEHTPSGLHSSHDTVAIVIQDEPDVIYCKPNVSETPVTHDSKKFIGPLPCQEFYIGPKKIEIPNNYCPSPTLFSLQDDARSDIKMNDAAWVLSRLDLSKISNYVINAFGLQQTMPG